MFKLINKFEFCFMFLLLFIAEFIQAANTKAFVLFSDVPVYKSGTLTTFDSLERADFTIKDTIYDLRTNISFWQRLGLRLSKKRVTSNEIWYYEYRPRESKFTITQNQATGDNEIHLPSGKSKQFFPNMECKILGTANAPSGQTPYCYVVSVDTTTDILTVAPTYEGKTLMAITAATHKLMVTGLIANQGAKRSTPNSTMEVKKQTWTRLGLNSFELTKTSNNQKMIGDSVRARQKKIIMTDHIVYAEDAMYKSGPAQEPKPANNMRGTSEGFIYGIAAESPNNYIEPGGTVPGYTTVDHIVRKLKKTVSGLFKAQVSQGVHLHKINTCNNAFTILVEELRNDGLCSVKPIDYKVYGYDGVERVKMFGGQFDMLETPQMNDLVPDSDKPAGVFIDPEYFEYWPMTDHIYEANVQSPGDQLIQDQVVSEAGWALPLKELHASFGPVDMYYF